jgi:DNA-binding CsgD family transcriptional regulator
MIATTHQQDAREFIFSGWRCRYGSRCSGLPTHAQVEVLAGLASGLTQKEIARLRGVSPTTIKAAVATLLYHLHATRASGAVAQAMRRGWIAPLLVTLFMGALNPTSDALRVRQPVRTRQPVSATSRVNRRDLGSIRT